MTKFAKLLARAKAGDADAQYEVARHYWNRRKPCKRRAVCWCRLAAEQGHTEAQWMLGCSLIL